ncbi:MAG: hypothetical protein AAGK14_02885 [Verrucomicrobiota bacterium]
MRLLSLLFTLYLTVLMEARSETKIVSLPGFPLGLENQASEVVMILAGKRGDLDLSANLVVKYDFYSWYEGEAPKTKTSATLYVNAWAPTRFRQEYDPYGIHGPDIAPGTDKGARTVVFDGLNLMSFEREEQVVSGRTVARQHGTIREWNPAANPFQLPVNYLSFTTLGCNTPSELGLSLLSELKSPERLASIKKNTPQELVVELFEGTDSKHRFTFDPKNKYALSKSENVHFDLETKQDIQVYRTLEIEEYAHPDFSPFPLPVRAKAVTKSQDGTLHGELIVKDIYLDDRPGSEIYSLAFPVGTRVRDYRLNLRFRVGEDAAETMRSIKRQVEPVNRIPRYE